MTRRRPRGCGRTAWSWVSEAGIRRARRREQQGQAEIRSTLCATAQLDSLRFLVRSTGASRTAQMLWCTPYVGWMCCAKAPWRSTQHHLS